MKPRPVENSQAYLDRFETVCAQDAYNSLSIEGYRVTPELIEKIRSGSWNPDGDRADPQLVAAMAPKVTLKRFD